MSIVAECPHCNDRFNLQPDLVGKVMRCPNQDCREPFVVQEVGVAPKSPPPPVSPGHRAGTVGDFVPVVDAEVAASAPALPRPKSPPKPAAPPPGEPEVVDAVVVAPPAGAKEVVWGEEDDADAPPRRKPARAEAEVVEDDDFIPRRKKRKSRGPVILIGLCVTTLIVGGAVGFYLLQHKQNLEEQRAQEATSQYERGEYGPASTSFEKLANDFPNSPDADKYRFFADLASARAVAGSVTLRDDPRPAVERLKGFIGAYTDSRFARPDAYGHDILDSGRKVLEDVTGFAQDRVAAFRADTPRVKHDEIRRAEDMLAAGRDFLPLLGPFRSKDDKPLDELGKPFDVVTAEIAHERDRMATLDQARDLVTATTDQGIEDAKALFRTKGYTDDPEAGQLIRTAEGDLLKRVKFERDPAAPEPPASPTAASLLFVAKVGATKPGTRGPTDDAPAVFLAVARGVLYALDEDTGDLLWATRVGPDVTDAPTATRLTLPDGPTDVALVTSSVGGRAAVSWVALRTGKALWSQPLTDPVTKAAAPAAGPAVVIGPRAFVPVRDANGSIYVFDVATGTRIGRMTIGHPVGPPAVAQPGTDLLYVAAEARRVFVFDTDPTGDPHCVRVIPTGHPPGTLRTPFVFLGPPGTDPAQRWVVLSQADGPRAMSVRVFPVPANAPQSAEAPPVVEPIAPTIEALLPGWAWFPPVSDGERLATVTDDGQVRIFGINQPGNRDTALFPLPHPTLPPPADGMPVPGLVVPAEEVAFWVLAGGSIQKFRLTLLPDRGQALVPAGTGMTVGAPTQPAQLNPRRDTACFVVRSGNSSGCRAVAVRLQDGEPRWQRQLGVISTSAPVRTEAGALLVDEDGGAVAVPAVGLPLPRAATTAAPEWVVAGPADDVSGPTRVAASPDGKTVFTVTPTGTGAAAKWAVRRVVDGKVNHVGSVTAPAALAGSPALMGGTLLIPAADGFVYRLGLGDGRAKPDTLAGGPKWLLDRRTPEPRCFITPLGGDAFLVSDGGKVLKRWTWRTGAGSEEGSGRWEFRERIATTPAVLPAAGNRPARLLVADATGGVYLYAADGGDAPIRRWVPGRTAALPGGKVLSDFAVQTDPAGRQFAAYVVDGKRVVCLNVDADDPLWVTPAADHAGRMLVGSPVPIGDGRWLVTDLAGRLAVLDGETGRAVASREVGLPGAVPAAAGVPVGDRVLLPLSDGSAAVVELQETQPEPKAANR